MAYTYQPFSTQPQQSGQTEQMSPYGVPWQQRRQRSQAQPPQGGSPYSTPSPQQGGAPSAYQSPYGSGQPQQLQQPQQPQQPTTSSGMYQQTQRQLASGEPMAATDQRTTTTTSTAAPQYAPTTSALPQPRSWDQFQAWARITYGQAFQPQDLQDVASAVGLPADPNIFASLGPEQWSQIQNALAATAQRRGVLPNVGLPVPEQPTSPIPSIGSAVEAVRNDMASRPQPYGQQIGELTGDLMDQPGRIAGFAPDGTPLLNQAAGGASWLMNAGPLVGQFQAPEQVAQAERNRVLQAIMGSPDVFGAQQQQQLFEQQKEQQTAFAEQARQRLSQQMASRGLSARGGAELFGQAGIEENLLSGLLGAQRDIALQTAEQNRAARLAAIQAVTGAQQADLGMATQAYQTGLQGAQANRAAQERALELGAQMAGQQFTQGLQGYQANLAAQAQQEEQQRQLLSQLFNMQTGLSDTERANIAMVLQADMARRQQQQAEYESNFRNVYDYNKWLEQAAAERRRLAMEEATTRYTVGRPY